MTASESLKDRVAALETEVARLRQQLEAATRKPDPWEKIYGSFADDPAHEEAMRLGREWRESFRPKPRKNRKAANARPGRGSPKLARKGSK